MLFLILNIWIDLARTAHCKPSFVFNSVNCENVLLVAVFFLLFLCFKIIILWNDFVRSCHQLFLFISVKCFVKKKSVKYFLDLFKLISLRMHIRLNLCSSFDDIILLPDSMSDISC